jgi:hypothetical protein
MARITWGSKRAARPRPERGFTTMVTSCCRGCWDAMPPDFTGIMLWHGMFGFREPPLGNRVGTRLDA